MTDGTSENNTGANDLLDGELITIGNRAYLDAVASGASEEIAEQARESAIDDAIKSRTETTDEIARHIMEAEAEKEQARIRDAEAFEAELEAENERENKVRALILSARQFREARGMMVRDFAGLGAPRDNNTPASESEIEETNIDTLEQAMAVLGLTERDRILIFGEEKSKASETPFGGSVHFHPLALNTAFHPLAKNTEYHPLAGKGAE